MRALILQIRLHGVLLLIICSAQSPSAGLNSDPQGTMDVLIYGGFSGDAVEGDVVKIDGKVRFGCVVPHNLCAMQLVLECVLFPLLRLQ